MPWLARQLHREHRFDIVHLHFPDPLGQLTAMALPRSVKRVISWHSDIVKQRAALALYRPFLDSFVRDAEAIIGASPQHFSSSQQMAPGKPGQIREVIPYGFDPSAFAWTDAARARRAELAKDARVRPVIFTVGRHVYYKGFEVLIRALRSVDADLWIGGRGPLTESFRSAARAADVADRVRFLGFVPDDELVAYYDACDLFCMPSTERAEQFGLVQLEAMHLGKPVVATRLGTGVEYVTLDGVTGLLVEPGNETALAEALNRLLPDPALRTRLGGAGQARVASTFSLQQMIDSTAALYRRLGR
jgi:rhamnosyl/mannosyltransferase